MIEERMQRVRIEVKMMVRDIKNETWRGGDEIVVTFCVTEGIYEVVRR